MIIEGLIITFLAGAAALAVAAFWKEISHFLKRAMDYAKGVVRAAVAGTKVFMQSLGREIKEISKVYQRDSNNRWHITNATTKVDANEVPKELRQKVPAYREVDVTDDIKKELELYL